MEGFLRGFGEAATIEGSAGWSRLGFDGPRPAAGGGTERDLILPVVCDGKIGRAGDCAGNPAGKSGSDAVRAAIGTEFRTIGRDRGFR